MEEFDSFESAAENPGVVEAAAKVTGGAEMPTPQDPTDGPVTLTAGFRRLKEGGTGFTDVRTAWVRELNGADEERISRAKMRDDAAAWVNAVLEAGVEKLGDLSATKDDLSSLVIGDRDYLLTQIARATYGDEIEYENLPCPHCGETMSVTLTYDDIPVKRLDSLDDQNFEVRLKNGRVAKVSLPTHSLSNEVMQSSTEAEANTILIANCVEEIRRPDGIAEHIGGDREAALRLGVSDRRKLVEEMSSRMPGPDYNGVKFNHDPGCGREVRLPITLADLFRGL